VDAGNNGRTTRPVPLLLYVHGGPQSRDYWGFDTYVQWMANRGYAVMQVLLYSAIDHCGCSAISAVRPVLVNSF
jgi:hypothetical protein